MLKLGYIAVMLGIALGGVFAFTQLNFAAAAFAGMAFFAWSHAYNLRFSATAEDMFARLKELAAQDPRVKVTITETQHKE